jgi:hypothetical protein
MNHLKQLGLAAQNHHSTRKCFPLGMEMATGLANTKATFFVRLLPYMEEMTLYSQWDFNNPSNNVGATASASRAATPLPNLICPSDQFTENPYHLNGPAAAFPAQSACGAVDGYYSATSYAGNFGEGSYYVKFSAFKITPDGVLFMTGSDPTLATLNPGLVDNLQNLKPVKIADITDGSTTTFMMGEKYHKDDFFDSWTSGNSGLKMYQVSAWGWSGGTKGLANLFCSSIAGINNSVRYWTASPNQIQSQDYRYNAWGSGHVGGACFVFCDNSVRFVKDSIDLTTLGRLSTRAEGKMVGASD